MSQFVTFSTTYTKIATVLLMVVFFFQANNPAILLVEANDYLQDGFTFAYNTGTFPATKLTGKLMLTPVKQWPTGFVKGPQAFSGGVVSGNYLYLAPRMASAVVRVLLSTGSSTAYSAWPAGFVVGSLGKFYGAVATNTHVIFVPYDCNMIVRLNIATGVMDGYSDFPATNLKTTDGTTLHSTTAT